MVHGVLRERALEKEKGQLELGGLEEKRDQQTDLERRDASAQQRPFSRRNETLQLEKLIVLLLGEEGPEKN